MYKPAYLSIYHSLIAVIFTFLSFFFVSSFFWLVNVLALFCYFFFLLFSKLISVYLFNLTFENLILHISSHNYDNYSKFPDVPECPGMFNVPCFTRRPKKEMYCYKI